MKTRSVTHIASLFLVSAFTAACSGDPDFIGSATDGTLAVRLYPAVQTGTRPAGEASQDNPSNGTFSDSELRTVRAYRFESGILQEILEGSATGEEGLYTFYSSSMSGELHFIANGDKAAALESLQPYAATEEQFRMIEAGIGQMVGSEVLMTGHLTLDGSTTNGTSVALRRSVARIDLVSADKDVLVHDVTIRNIATKGYVNEQERLLTPSSAGKDTFHKSYPDLPFGNRRETLLYLCEQKNETLAVEALVSFGGGLHRMQSRLPSEIHRNTIYTLQVHGKGADATLSVIAGDWEAGGETGTTPHPKALIDVEASALTDGVRVSATRDTVFISHTPKEFRLVLLAEPDAGISVEGWVAGASVSPEPIDRTLQQVASVAVSSALRMPGSTEEYIYLDLHDAAASTGRVVLVFEAHPVQLDGLVELDDNGLCDFGRYVEGELSRITMTKEKAIRLEFDAGTDAWMKLVADNGSRRLLAGWKPNDPKADGRIQEGHLVISEPDGSEEERYTIRRRNWGLPVVRIGGTWWGKYNLRGTAGAFADQVSIADDPASGAALTDYLSRCDETELLRLLGDQYQAGNPQGLPLRHDGSAFYHEGMQPSGQNFGTMDPAAMTPEGYRIPDYDDYAFFSGSENYNLGGVGQRTYKNMAGEEMGIRIVERDVNFLGHGYGVVAFYEFQTGDACWTLCGLGHQWDTAPGNIARMMVLFATYGNASKTWYMEGYAQQVKPNQNWFKYTAQNTTKTRTIRCIKAPVEYIYE